MEKWKQRLRPFIFPPLFLVYIFVVLAIVGLIYSFCFENSIPYIQYCSYGISAYALLIVGFRVPNLIRFIKSVKENNKLVVRLRKDVNFRLKVSLSMTVATSFSFSALNLLIGIIYSSLWEYSLAGYYVLVLIIKLFLLTDIVKNRGDELLQWKRYGFYGCLLVVMNVALSLIVFLVVRENKGFSYHYIYTIALAAFTFTITTTSAINFFRYRKNSHPLMLSIKSISLCSALVSMLSLQTAMLNAFSEDGSEKFTQIVNASFGFVVCTAVLIIGIIMVVISIKKRKQLT